MLERYKKLVNENYEEPITCNYILMTAWTRIFWGICTIESSYFNSLKDEFNSYSLYPISEINYPYFTQKKI